MESSIVQHRGGEPMKQCLLWKVDAVASYTN